MKSLVLITSLFFCLNSWAAAPKGITSLFNKSEQLKEQNKAQKTLSKEEILQYLSIETKKSDKMDLLGVSERLYTAGEYLDKEFDENFLQSILSYYPEILKREMSHTLVEMFADSYKKNQKRFDLALDKKLSSEQKNDFIERLKAAYYEAEHGQD